MNTVKMNNGTDIPVIGLGTYTIAPVDARRSVCEALKMGYRLVDTANAYVNERSFEILDFTLTDDEMKEIAKINKNERYYNRTDAQLEHFAGWQPQYEAKRGD